MEENKGGYVNPDMLEGTKNWVETQIKSVMQLLDTELLALKEAEKKLTDTKKTIEEYNEKVGLYKKDLDRL